MCDKCINIAENSNSEKQRFLSFDKIILRKVKERILN